MPPELLEFVNKFVLFGMPGVPLVMLLVQIAKWAGLPSRWAPIACLVSGLIVAGGIATTEFVPEAEPLVMYVLGGILMGAAAAGVWSGAKALRGFKSAEPGSVVVPPDALATM